MLDPGTRKPRTRAAVASASGSKMIPKRDSAASKLGRAVQAGRLGLDELDVLEARRRAFAAVGQHLGEMSVATTLPSAPATAAAVSDGSP